MPFNQKRYNQSIRGIAVTACKASKRRAKDKNLPFDLTSDYLRVIMEDTIHF